MTQGSGRFAQDDGAPDRGIRCSSDSRELLAALSSGRVLVAITAQATRGSERSGEHRGRDGEDTEMSVVSMVSADGRRGLLVFSGLDSLRAWDPKARPVPVSGPDAARAALDDGCQALVVDVSGPRTQVLTEADLVDLAGADPLPIARDIAQGVVDAAFGAGRVQVSIHGEGLRVLGDGISTRALAAAIPPRVRALAAVEVLA